MEKPTIVIAGDRHQFLEYKKYWPTSLGPLIEASSVQKIMGVAARGVSYTGSYVERKDWPEISRIAESQVR